MTKNIDYQIIVDNTAHTHNLETEHGLAVWIEADGKNILFDSSQSSMIVENAKKLNIPLEKTDILILSHGHYDHTGGLEALQNILRDNVIIYAHPDIMLERYSRHANGDIKEIGITKSGREFINKREKYIQWIDMPSAITEKIWLTGFVPRFTEFEDTGGDFWLEKKCITPDVINDDMSLWFESEAGIWLFLGCAHAGIINIIKHIKSINKDDKFYAIVGGTHLRNASNERIEKTVSYIKKLNLNIFTPCHCTGGKIEAW